MSGHDTRAHSSLGASSSERWMACPGSIRLSEGVAKSSNRFADEGTAAHTLGEKCLKSNTDPDEYLGDEIVVNGVKYEVTDEMAAAVKIYVDFVRELDRRGAELDIEQRFDLSALHPGMFGTCDCVAYLPEIRQLIVIDYKHGRGVRVDPERNPQLLYYGIGALQRMHNRGVRTVRLVVIQPRARDSEIPVREWVCDAVELLEFRTELVRAARATEADDAPLVPGDHCKFCPAAGFCPAKRDQAFGLAKADFDVDTGEVILSDPATFDKETFAQVLANIDQVEDFCRRVRELAHHEFEAGRPIPGFKLVGKRPTRHWNDTDGLIDLMERMGFGDEIWTEPELKSPAQVERLLRKSKKVVAKFITSSSSGTVVVPESDPRAPVSAEASEDFAG